MDLCFTGFVGTIGLVLPTWVCAVPCMTLVGGAGTQYQPQRLELLEAAHSHSLYRLQLPLLAGHTEFCLPPSVPKHHVGSGDYQIFLQNKHPTAPTFLGN